MDCQLLALHICLIRVEKYFIFIFQSKKKTFKENNPMEHASHSMINCSTATANIDSVKSSPTEKIKRREKRNITEVYNL